MRVLMVVEATIAGVRRHVHTLATGLAAQGYDVTVACPERRQRSYGEDEFASECRAAGLPVVPLPLQREVGLLPDARALAATLRLLRQGRFDLVHTHSSKAGFVGRVAASSAGIPSLHTPNGLHLLGVAHPLRRQFYLRLEQSLGRLSRFLIAVSPSEAALMRRYNLAPSARIVCVPNGIDLPSNLEPVARNLLGVPHGVPFVGTLARLEPQKNPALFVRAAALLRRALPEARFVWCGDGALRAETEQLARNLGLGSHVSFVGYRADARQILAALDAFWLTSRFEGLPQAPLEALALGVPVVATDVVGTHDLLAGTGAGMLVPPDDAPALVRATLDVLARPALRQHITGRGRRLVQERYSNMQMIAATAQLYAAAVQPGGMQELAIREVSLER